MHGPSRIVATGDFRWSDAGWRGLPLGELIFYELHVGTFSPEGTFAGVAAKLPYLRDLGVTAIELMPVATFPGARNWGYDGASLFAPHEAYGGPEGLRRLVDACHAHGLALFLDVVYNHLGPEGNYLHDFGPYFTDRYQTPWGAALNFDGPDSDEVRRFFVDNALHWLTDYHVDGLRLDAIHGIFDFGARHILGEISRRVSRRGGAARAPRLAGRRERSERSARHPAGRGRGARPRRAVERRLSPRAARGRSPATGAATSSTSVAPADLAKAIATASSTTGSRRRSGGGATAPRRRASPASGSWPSTRTTTRSPTPARGGASVRSSARNARRSRRWCCSRRPRCRCCFRARNTARRRRSTTSPATAIRRWPRRCARGGTRSTSTFSKRARTSGVWADPQAEETFLRAKLRWESLARPPHAEMLAFYRALIALRRRLAPLHNGRKDLTRVTADEAGRWLTIERGDPSGAATFTAANFGEQAAAIRLPADGGRLASWRSPPRRRCRRVRRGTLLVPPDRPRPRVRGATLPTARARQRPCICQRPSGRSASSTLLVLCRSSADADPEPLQVPQVT